MLSDLSVFHFTRFKFGISFTQAGKVPMYKTSAFRGGMGQVLLQMFCILESKRKDDCNNELCSKCIAKDRCIVQNIMYSKYKIKPDFVTEGESAGFTLYCKDNREYVNEGDKCTAELTLFGDVVAMFNPILQAFYVLGLKGLGKEKVRFKIDNVRNIYGENIVDGMDVKVNKIVIEDSTSYIRKRIGELKNANDFYRLDFFSPCTIKNKGEFLRKFEIEALLFSIIRRYRMYCMFEGNEVDEIRLDSFPTVIKQREEFITVTRYSNRSEKKIEIKGICGYMDITKVSDDLLELLIIGEISQIGKNTKFGFGRYICYNKEY